MRKLRNIAIIAHVDHGKTTLVDKMILQGKQFRANEKPAGELILDNNDQERERGITILAKNVSVHYKDYKINIIDTPGHSDFGGEVERVLNMADGVLLLVDAFEGTMPQTRFVLQKALGLGKKAIVVVNKVDKPNCRPDEVQEEVFDLMFSLGASEEQLDFKTIYGSAKEGWMSTDWRLRTSDITPLLDAIIEDIPEPEAAEGTPQMMITSLEYSSYIGRIAIGKLTRGKLRSGMPITLCKRDGVTQVKSRIKDLMLFEGLEKQKVDEVDAGEICAIVGIEGFEIGDTIADYENPEALKEFIFAAAYDAEQSQSYGGTTYLTLAAIAADDIQQMPVFEDEDGNPLEEETMVTFYPNGVNNGWAGIRIPYEFVQKYFSVKDADYGEGSYECDDARGQMFYIKGREESMDGALYQFTNGWSCLKFNNVPHDTEPLYWYAEAATKAYSDIDYPLIRLGEIYLIYAEACFRLNDRDEALPYLQELSERAGVEGPAASYTENYLIEERARELYWEGHRRTDLIRFGKFHSGDFLWPYKGGESFGGQSFERYKNLFALPLTDLAANPTLKQNEGYPDNR